MTIAAQLLLIFLSVFAIGAALFAIVGTAGAKQQTRSLRTLERDVDLICQMLAARLEKLEDDKALRDAAKEKGRGSFGDMAASEILAYLEQQIDAPYLGGWVAKAIAEKMPDPDGLTEVAKRLCAVEAHVGTITAEVQAMSESISGPLAPLWTVKTQTDSTGRTYVAGLPTMSIGVNDATLKHAAVKSEASRLVLIVTPHSTPTNDQAALLRSTLMEQLPGIDVAILPAGEAILKRI